MVCMRLLLHHIMTTLLASGVLICLLADSHATQSAALAASTAGLARAWAQLPSAAQLCAMQSCFVLTRKGDDFMGRRGKSASL